MKRQSFTGRKITALTIVFVGLASIFLSAVYFRAEARKNHPDSAQPVNAELETAIENALYARAEFFGAEAIVPFPTAEARTRLAALLESNPKEPDIYLKLSELDEKLNHYEEAEREMNVFVELNSADQPSLEKLAAYFHRRAQFELEAATLERILAKSNQADRAETFAQLIELARNHRLEKYLKPDFYREIILQDPSSFAVVEKFIGKLVEENNYAEALATLREYRRSFPGRDELLDKEIEILLAMKKPVEAESVYHQAFNPFWSQAQNQKYYNFLSEQERYRAYGNELREKFKRAPVDFDTAVRLFHFQNYDNEAAPEIFARLEKERAAKKIAWQPQELLTVSRLLIKAGSGDAASRFLYTLFFQNKSANGDQLHAKILYQLFEILSDAGEQRIALTRGDLKFYRDVAAADSDPGMTTGILSLIFSDSNPAKRLKEKESTANKLFNRAAAYRIFQLYKTENPTSPQLGQMYLDIVRLYTSTGETETAARTLAEFEARPEFKQNAAASNYPNIALKLADAYITAKNFNRERQVYQNILDYLGKKQIAVGHSLITAATDSMEPTAVKPDVASYPPSSNSGISLTSKTAASKWENEDLRDSFTDFFEDGKNEITYSEILNRFVASLARENKTPEILALYAAEIKKYPQESGLDERLLQWLGQTNLVEEQLKVYRQALDKFPNATWQDRLARWFLRQDRRQDFEKFSGELIEKLDDTETGNYLAEFVAQKSNAKLESFDAQLYLALYEKAHRRFPHNLNFVQGLLNFYKTHAQQTEWQHLTAEYYFESSAVREMFLNDLASLNQLRSMQIQASEKLSANDNTQSFALLPYKLFRADAARRLSNYEDAVEAYRELNSLYPNTPEYAEPLVAVTRSLGQINRKFLTESAALAHAQADSAPAVQEYRTRAGEIQAELGNYPAARAEWLKLLETNEGEPETYLETATVFWDYFQYDDALAIIKNLREQRRDDTLYAFESAAILETQHNLPAALAEYVKALDGSTPEAVNVVSSDRAKRRLETIYERPGVALELAQAFERERSRRADKSTLILGYADFLRRVKQWKTAAVILKTEMIRSKSSDFLLESKELASIAEDGEIGNLALKRLADIAQSRRSSIRYRFQLAESLNDAKKPVQAAAVVGETVRKFPTNYGVINQADEFFWHINHRPEALRVLQASLQLAKGEYRVKLGQKLAERYLEQKNNRAAELILQQLYNENPLDSGVYDELTKIYVRTKNTTALQQIFERTLTEIKHQDIDFREITDNVAELRTQMIAALTSLKDYRAAVAQHIEIINRDPAADEKIEAAIDYVTRYGSADILADYYRKAAAESYKNYRWFVILARIYEAGKDDAGAVENYRQAINNQPEKPELYDALAKIYERQGNYQAAIDNLNKTLQLSNDDPVYLKRIIAVYLKAGRSEDAAAVRQKLPAAPVGPKLSVSDQFAAAAALQNTEREKAIEMSRAAFETIAQNPLTNEIKAADITTYVNIVRGAEPLDSVADKLWTLRDKLILESEQPDSTNAGKMLAAQQTLDGAMTEAIGSVARNYATGRARDALFSNLKKRIETASGATDAHQTLALLQNLSRKAGFGALEEQLLIGKTDAALANGTSAEFHNQLNYLLAFYRERADYRRVSELLETMRAKDGDAQHFAYAQQSAENARITGNREKELSALRDCFTQLSDKSCADCLPKPSDALVIRYFEILLEAGDAGRNELGKLSRENSQYQLQLINFLLAKGEKELAHQAIEDSQFPTTWKQARQAQTSLALGEYAEKNHGYFRVALNLKSIGELIGEKPDAEKQLVGDDWFRAADIYGKWLDQSQTAPEKSALFLPAIIENRPHDAGAQANLGRWYLERKENSRAIEHLQISLEIEPGNKYTTASLGEAFFESGDAGKAHEYWAKIIAGDKPEFAEFALYLETLKKHGLAAEAREKLAEIVTANLNKLTARSAENIDVDDRQGLETTKKEIHLLADSFGDYEKDQSLATAESDFFLNLSKNVKENTLLPEFLMFDALITEHNRLPFYDLLIERSANDLGSDFKFTQLLKTTFDARAAEALLDQQEHYKTEEPAGNKIKWQRERLELLLAENQTAAAQQAVAALEKQMGRSFARPDWLRIAAWRWQMRDGKAAQTLSELKQFVGAGVAPTAPKIAAPSLDRLNEAVNLLNQENQNATAAELQQSFYARRLALEQFDAPTFVGLATTAFKRGDANFGTKLLQLMTDLSDNERKTTAAAELTRIEIIKNYAADSTKLEDVPATNSLNPSEALKMAAETAGKFGQFDAALDFRQKLRTALPADEINRLELARLFAAKQNQGEAIKILSELINDRLSLRNRRWQAVLLAAEICADHAESWENLKNLLPDLATTDTELSTAVNALELNQTGRADSARELLKPVASNAFLQFLSANFARQSGLPEAALKGFLNVLEADKNAEFAEVFGFMADEPAREIIGLYVETGRPVAAFNLAEADPKLNSSSGSLSADGYQTLAERTATRETQSRLALLKKLSLAAEQNGDFRRAAAFEKTGENLLTDAGERQAIETRVEFLLNRDKETAVRPATNLTVNQKNFSE